MFTSPPPRNDILAEGGTKYPKMTNMETYNYQRTKSSPALHFTWIYVTIRMKRLAQLPFHADFLTLKHNTLCNAKFKIQGKTPGKINTENSFILTLDPIFFTDFILKCTCTESYRQLTLGLLTSMLIGLGL